MILIQSICVFMLVDHQALLGAELLIGQGFFVQSADNSELRTLRKYIYVYRYNLKSSKTQIPNEAS